MDCNSITFDRAVTPHNIEHATKVRNLLMQAVKSVDDNRDSYLNDPKAFMRKRKISFNDLLIFVMLLSRGDMTENIRKLTEGVNPFTEQALYKRMNQVSSQAFVDLFHKFNMLVKFMQKANKKWHFYAIDGTENRTYADENDPEGTAKTRGKPNGSTRMIALYDVDNQMFVDARLSRKVKTSEPQYAIDLIENYPLPDNAIVAGDRYYGGLQTLAAFVENNVNFLIRLKDQTSKTSWLKNLGLPDGAYDLNVTLRLSRSQKKSVIEGAEKDGCLYIHLQSEFQYLAEDELYYDLPLRLIRFYNPSGNEGKGEWVTLATNLSKKDYKAREAKIDYTKRWGIETAFLELKYFCDMEYFHSRKRNLIEQEIWAKMTYYNACSLFRQMVGVFKKEKLYHKLNLKQATYPITKFLLNQYDIEKFLIELYKKTSPIRDGRHDPRKSGKHKGPRSWSGQ